MSVDLNRRSSRAARGLLAVIFTVVAFLPVAGGYLKAQQQPPAAPQGSSGTAFQKGFDLLREKKYADADQAFRDARQLDPTNPRALLGQVETRMAQGKSDEAIQLLQAEVNKNPQRMDLRLALGNTAARAGNYDLALATFQGMLGNLDKGSKSYGDLYMRIGETYRRKGDLESAITSLRQASETIPDNLVVKGTLALVLDGARRSQEAELEYRRVIALDPENGVAMNNLAYLLSQHGGDLDEAMALAQRAHDVLPGNDEVSDTLGWICLKKNLPDPAIGIFEQLVEKQPARSTFHYHLAMAFAQKGYTSTATEQLKVALACGPSETEALKIRELLARLAQ